MVMPKMFWPRPRSGRVEALVSRTLSQSFQIFNHRRAISQVLVPVVSGRSVDVVEFRPTRPAPPFTHAPRQQQSAANVSRHPQRGQTGYTLAHAGRQVRIGPVAFWIGVGTLIVMAVWSIATGSYFAFKENVLTRLIGRQAEMQFAYEDRIAELRAQVDRVTSRQLLDQEQFEHKLDVLATSASEPGTAQRGARRRSFGDQARAESGAARRR